MSTGHCDWGARISGLGVGCTTFSKHKGVLVPVGGLHSAQFTIAWATQSGLFSVHVGVQRVVIRDGIALRILFPAFAVLGMSTLYARALPDTHCKEKEPEVCRSSSVLKVLNRKALVTRPATGSHREWHVHFCPTSAKRKKDKIKKS